MLELDHVVFGCLDLDDGEAWLRARLGVALAPGGRHVGWGTHNRLLQLGGGVYLELIAPDPSQPEPVSPRPFMLDDPALRTRLRAAPRLVHWLVRSDDLEADLASLRHDPGPVAPMTRGALRWRITLPPGGRPADDGLLPSVIAWDVPEAERPAARLPEAGLRLASLAVHAPRPTIARRPALRAGTPEVEWIESAEPALRARFDTPAGRVELG